MPTTYKAQLEHHRYSWDDSLKYELHLILPEIVKAIGLARQRSDSPDGIVDGPDEEELIRRIDGILSQAAAVRIDADSLPVNKLIATLLAVKKKPSLVHSAAIEPEALSVLQQNYQRNDEAPGAYRTDFEFPDIKSRIPLRAIEKAATLAIDSLSREVRTGRRPDPLLADVGARLAELYLQYNPGIWRVSRASARLHKSTQAEDGAFLHFVDVVLTPLNKYLSSTPAKPRVLIPAQVVRAYLDERMRATHLAGG